MASAGAAYPPDARACPRRSAEFGDAAIAAGWSDDRATAQGDRAQLLGSCRFTDAFDLGLPILPSSGELDCQLRDTPTLEARCPERCLVRFKGAIVAHE